MSPSGQDWRRLADTHQAPLTTRLYYQTCRSEHRQPSGKQAKCRVLAGSFADRGREREAAQQAAVHVRVKKKRDQKAKAARKRDEAHTEEETRRQEVATATKNEETS